MPCYKGIYFANAYNCLRCDTMLEKVRKHSPSLYCMAWQAYANPFNLFFGDEGTILSQLGIQQGDPMGQAWIYLLRTEYDRSRIFDIRPKPKFSFQKIRPSAEDLSQSRRYEFCKFCLWNSFSSPNSEVECIKYNLLDFCTC